MIVRSKCPHLGSTVHQQCCHPTKKWCLMSNTISRRSLYSQPLGLKFFWSASLTILLLLPKMRILPVSYLMPACLGLTSCKSVGCLLNRPGIEQLVQHIETVLGFFVVEEKQRGLQLEDHIPQVLTELYAAARKLKCGFYLHFPTLKNF